MPNFAAIRVTIGRSSNGAAQYPNFNSLAVVSASGLDWSKYVDVKGMGWNYDKTSGHDDENPGSPRGQQFGILLIPEQFAVQAIAGFPATCTRLTETQCENFWDTKHAVEEEEELSDGRALEELEREHRMMLTLQGTPEAPSDVAEKLTKIRQKIKRALDPAHRARGVRNNPKSTWQRIKSHRNITFVEA